jgi:hypothetical protein
VDDAWGVVDFFGVEWMGFGLLGHGEAVANCWLLVGSEDGDYCLERNGRGSCIVGARYALINNQ